MTLRRSLLTRRFWILFVGLAVLAGLRPSIGRAQEDCIGFDPDRAAVQYAGGRWKIVVGNMWLLDFGRSRAEADLALRIIKHYGMNSQCFVGRPDASMEYYLVDGQAPAGAFPGEDAIAFDPSRLEIRNVGGRWKIVEGNHLLMDFGGSVSEARTSLALIHKYGFNRICFVGRPDPSMVYFRKDCSGLDFVTLSLDANQLVINGDRVGYAARYRDDCGQPVDAVLQTWIEQGRTRRAAGGVRISCGAGSTCAQRFTIGADDQNAAGSGRLVPGRAVAVFELLKNGQKVAERRVPVVLVARCAGIDFTDLSLSSHQLTINGENVPYTAEYRDDCGRPIDGTLQAWIEQDRTRRAAGGVQIDCGAGQDCAQRFTILANDQTTAGSGELNPGRAVAVFQILVGGQAVAERRVAVELVEPEPEEDCVSFDPDRLQVRRIGPNWTLVDGNHLLKSFGANLAEARQALAIIKHYGMNSLCFVGRPDPSLEYFLVDGEAPRGPLAGEDCVPFNPARLEVRLVEGRWKIVEGDHWMLDFDRNFAEAQRSLEIIREHGFNRLCFVGRPDASMTYFRIEDGQSETEGPVFVRGDVDGNGLLDLADGLGAADYLFIGRQRVTCMKALDSDDSGVVDIGDVIHVFSYLFISGPPPAAPFPRCGVDATIDRLTCGLVRSCR